MNAGHALRAGPSKGWLLIEVALGTGVCLMQVALGGGLTSETLTVGLVTALLVIVPSELLRHFVGVENLKRALLALRSNRTRARSLPPVDPTELEARMRVLRALHELGRRFPERKEPGETETHAEAAREPGDIRISAAKGPLPEPPSMADLAAFEAALAQVRATLAHSASFAAALAQVQATIAEAAAQSRPALAEIEAAQEVLVRHLRVPMLRLLAEMEAGRSHWGKAEEYLHDALHDVEESRAR